MHWIHAFVDWYIQQMHTIGLELYVFLGMTIESSFFPLPSEFVMPPAAQQAAHAGGFPRVLLLIALGTLGSQLGAYCMYSLGYFLGRPFFEKYGKYIFVSPKHMAHVDRFWENYGEASTFIGRLVPAVRHLISLPAGFARMNIWKFTLYTSAGAGFWVTVLGMLGWFLRDWTMDDFETKLKGRMMPYLFATIALMIGAYVAKVMISRRKRRSVS